MPELDTSYSPADLEQVKQVFCSHQYGPAISRIFERSKDLAAKFEAIHTFLLDKGWEVCSRCGRFQPVAAVVNGEKIRCKTCGVQ